MKKSNGFGAPKSIADADRDFPDTVFDLSGHSIDSNKPLLDRDDVLHFLRTHFPKFPRRKPTVIIYFLDESRCFWDDYWRIAEILWSLGISDIRCVSGSSYYKYRSMSFSSGRGSLSMKEKPCTTPRSEEVLVLSDFGQFRAVNNEERWRKEFQRYSGSGLHAVGWSPASWAYCSRFASYSIFPFTDKWTSKRDGMWGGDALDTLLTALSPAIRVEPCVIRPIRRMLGSDLSLEGYVYADSRVDAGSAVLTFVDPMSFREKFHQLPQDVQEKTVEVLIEMHGSGMSPVILAEEILTWSVLTTSQKYASDIALAEQFMQRIAIRLYDNPGHEKGDFLHWARRFVERNRGNEALWKKYLCLSVIYAIAQADSLKDGFDDDELLDGVSPDEVRRTLRLG